MAITAGEIIYKAEVDTSEAVASSNALTSSFDKNSRSATNNNSKLKQQSQGSNDAARGMDNANNNSRSLSKSFASLTTIIGTMGINRLASDVISTGIAFESMNEQASKALNILLDDAGAADKLQGQLKSIADSTQFSLESVNQLGILLVNAGVSAEDVPKDIEAITNAVGAVGGSTATLERATLGLSQAYQKGKLQAQDMRQIQEAGIPITQLLADVMGVSESQIYDLASAGEIGKDEMDKLFDAMNQEFEGGASVDTLGEKIANMRDQASEVAGELISKFAPAIELMVDGLTKSFDWLDQNQWALTALGVVFGIFIGVLNLVVFGLMAQVLWIVLSTAKNIIWNKAIVGSIKGSVKFVKSLAKMIPKLVISGIEFVIAAAGATGWAVAMAAQTAAQVAATVATWAMNAALAVLNALALPIVIGILAIVAAIVIVIVIIMNWGAIVDWLTEKWNQTVEFFNWLWQTIVNTFNNAIDSIVQWITDQFNSIVQWIIDTWNGVLDFFSKLWDEINKVFNKALDWLYDNTIGRLQDLLDWILDWGGKVKDGITGALQSLNPFKSASLNTNIMATGTSSKLMSTAGVGGNIINGSKNINNSNNSRNFNPNIIIAPEASAREVHMGIIKAAQDQSFRGGNVFL